jgi:nucleoside-diphosphate-sugar epimerase
MSSCGETKKYYPVVGEAETVKKLVGDVEIEYKEGRPGDFEGKVVLAEKARSELGWEPKVDFEEGVRRYIEWYKQNRKI